MPSRIKTLLAFLCVLAISVFASQFWLDRPQESERASSASCAVYRSFYNQVSEKRAVFFRPTSRPYNPKQSQGALRRFERDTGKFESIRISPKTEPYKKPITEKFEKDTSGFFKPLLSNKAISLKPCFDEISHRPQFYDGSFKWLSFREELLGWFGRGDRVFATILSVSPVGFSEDGQHALLYSEYYCTGFCGGGGFHLFEMRSGSWTEIGYNLIWVS